MCKPINEEEMKTQIMEILGKEKYPEIEKEFEILDESGTKTGCVRLKLNEILYFEYIKDPEKQQLSWKIADMNVNVHLKTLWKNCIHMILR